MAYSKNFSIEELRFDNKGLIPAIAQDWLDGSILMLAWMNKESLNKTLETRNVHYWSRSRSEIWRKGATSGSTQFLKEIRFDCDNDALVLSIEQNGSGACHTGEKSCFFNEIDSISMNKTAKKTSPFSNICSELFDTLHERSINPLEKSYTNHLLTKGSNTILKKIGEETAEFIMACKDNDKDEIANEASDIIYHLQVALIYKGVKWRDVLNVLESRRGKNN
ncbi:Phosphoribosyl-AMP cyclohydrolase [Prochlorococcus marinus subsp. pastoris str. CCMP1986]|uniref:Histidine biosynthesis bifunctional protein HisIE n=1 Tax=Prochlorococcus marinus subsp. pastoris (strain CCMP1986 / NIES-2087 / MED4) TaxID=59919 RepID=HIS2_PROMP|nr:bifunctional phosphoribosyl-AMP cyclohydrolase/phosphoribosyl-ATP diphosphatase HisIE [Prochlorococcus marinus]Q7TUC7.1 RecName: Full=Histidine biosynthesis bifunctional protein HisIE; Includes: RecName: Full=Phosphoribosyl-AMP cyclohydrolase; Short=PRA-CH; Includes: RecName: Full=Phosphoribosyl-ATP pyrophosphatase; Short=PRA-PH [Prochlorococcus marinus subsp. pastoris str. CCMP1986]KGF86072.1 Phosphoribosyl-AMP cyclohydrolase [Prochlorococcus marinus str. EQPAC1]CAE19037.1 Phosphoribosyl-AMP